MLKGNKLLTVVMEWIWERYKVSAMHKLIHCTTYNQCPDGQAGRAPDSRITIRVRVPIGAIFTRHTVNQFFIDYFLKVVNYNY